MVCTRHLDSFISVLRDDGIMALYVESRLKGQRCVHIILYDQQVQRSVGYRCFHDSISSQRKNKTTFQ
jgi:hypothetical protein